jgi:hypothetical protein
MMGDMPPPLALGPRCPRPILYACENVEQNVAHDHAERNHQGKSNVLLFPPVSETRSDQAVECCERLGGLLRYYHRAA